MQRWLFFIFCLAQVSLSAQSIDITEVQLSLWKQGERASAGDLVMNAKANISFNVDKAQKQVGFVCKGLTIHEVRLREGRLKDRLTFDQKKDSLIVNFPKQRSGKTSIELEYEIKLDDELSSLYIQRTEDVLAFNPMNPSTTEGMGVEGMFFPTRIDDKFELKLDVTISDDENIGFPGSEEFRVKLADGTAQFWGSTGQISAKDFYLIIGTFKEFDAEEMEEEFALGEVVLKQMKFEKSKRDVAPFMALYGLPETAVSDSEYALIDSISTEDFAGSYFLKKQDLPAISDDRYQKEAAIAYYLEGYNAAKASERHWQAYSKNKGEAWVEKLMQRKWVQRAELEQKDYEKVFTYILAKYKDANADLMAVISTAEWDTAFVEPMRNTRLVPKVNFEYRYVGGDTALYVKYTQDTVQSTVFHFPVKVEMIAGDVKETRTGIVRDVSGELKMHFDKAPNLAGVSAGVGFLGELTEKRPDAYNLYQLSHASTEAEREEALLGLFKTSNQNLFSTALGIAMDDKSVSIRSLAMDYANDLNLAGQRKLKDTLLHLSTDDPSDEVREKAKILVTKYYESK